MHKDVDACDIQLEELEVDNAAEKSLPNLMYCFVHICLDCLMTDYFFRSLFVSLRMKLAFACKKTSNVQDVVGFRLPAIRSEQAIFRLDEQSKIG